ncbi:PilZ domain-containing protein [uncultured Marinobacter sp.]|uniref:PilZ domain-containing protein n=1 Tax=uncultured Marinobacter sp. TaxID=187379 RepID=UPI0030DD262F
MTADDYSFGTTDTTHGNDQREEYRLTGRVRVWIELESAVPEHGDSTRRIEASSYDVSSAGLRVGVAETLTRGALLPVTIALDSHHSTFELMAEVVWCREVPGDGLQAGLRLVESDETAYLEWMEAVARAMEEN